MRNTIYYGAIFTRERWGALTCVSACFPHLLTYAEPGPQPGMGGTTEQVRVDGPSPSSAGNPCTLTIWVNLADVGNPASKKLAATPRPSSRMPSPIPWPRQIQFRKIDAVGCYNTRP
jgi:hypothetical protein